MLWPIRLVLRAGQPFLSQAWAAGAVLPGPELSCRRLREPEVARDAGGGGAEGQQVSTLVWGRPGPDLTHRGTLNERCHFLSLSVLGAKWRQ